MAELETLDFVTITTKLLLSQYKKPNFLSLMKIISKIFSDIQDNNFLLRSKFWIENATGEQLNFLGALWDTSRNGKSDSEYRADIYISINKSVSGTINEIKNILKSAYGATYTNYFTDYPAGFYIETDAFISQTNLNSISPSGVHGVSVIPEPGGDYIIDSSGAYVVDSENFPIIDSGI